PRPGAKAAKAGSRAGPATAAGPGRGRAAGPPAGGPAHSGKGAASPPPPPLRTVLATFTAHGSSKSLTAQLQSYRLRVPDRLLFLLADDRVSVLVAVQVYQLSVAARVRPAHAPWHLVMAVKLLSVYQLRAADRATPVLGLGQPHVTGGQVAGVDPLPRP